MLFEEIKKIAPPLSAFLERVAPDLGKEEVAIRKPKGIPRSIRFVGKCYLFQYRNPVGKGTPDPFSPFSNGDQFGAKVKHNARSQSILSST